MQISLLTLFATVFGVSPLFTHHLFRQAYLWERHQIATDNAAIIMGRGDRELLNYLWRANQVVMGMEKIHHAFHICARSLGASSSCIAEDRVLEHSIQSFHQSVWGIALARWTSTAVSVNAELNRMETKCILLSRGYRPPIRSKSCPVCGLAVAWDVDPAVLPWIHTIQARVEPRVSKKIIETAVWLRPDLHGEKQKWDFVLVKSGVGN